MASAKSPAIRRHSLRTAVLAVRSVNRSSASSASLRSPVSSRFRICGGNSQRMEPGILRRDNTLTPVPCPRDVGPTELRHSAVPPTGCPFRDAPRCPCTPWPGLLTTPPMPEGVAARSVQSWCRSAPSVCPFDVIRQYGRGIRRGAGRVDLRIREVVRLTEPGPAYVCPVEQRPLKLRFAEVGVGQICSRKIGICAVCRGYDRPLHQRIREVRNEQLRAR